MTEGNGEVRELPKGWILVQHKDIAEINPKLPFNDLSDDLLVSFLPMAAVEEKSGRFSLSEIREYEKVKKGYTQFVNGDLIFAKITPCMENGKVAIVENLQNGIGFGSTEFHVSRLTSLTSRKYLFYYFVQEKFRRDARQKMTGSAGQLRVSKSYFEEIKIPLAPLLEQERIIEKVEELFSDVDQGIKSLKTSQKQLKVYRQAVLKWAFEGKLTEEWRKQQSTLKTGEALLAQIKAERESRYQQQLAEWEEKVREWEAIGKVGKKPTKPQKSKELSPITKSECSKLPQLPSSWSWAKIGNIARIGTGVTPLKKKNEYYENGSVPWVTSGALNESYVRRASDFITDLALKETNLRIYPKHTLLVALYGEGKTRGKCSELLIESTTNQAIAAIIQDTMEGRIRPYLKCFLQKNYDEIRLKSSGGVQPNLNLSIVENTIFPICSLEEQEQIVQEIESRLSICDQLEATIIENLQKAEALRQSILKQAFEGRLVPQDPNDEPAEKLLERIQAEREANGNTGKKSKPSPQQLTLQDF